MVAAAFAAARNTALAAMALAVPLAYHADLAAARLGVGRRARAPANRRGRRARPRASSAPSMPLALQVAVGARGARAGAGVPDCCPARCARAIPLSGRAPSASWPPTSLAAMCSANTAGAAISSGTRRAGSQGLHRQPLRDDLSAACPARLPGFSPRRRRRRRGARRVSDRLRADAFRFGALAFHGRASRDGVWSIAIRSRRCSRAPTRPPRISQGVPVLRDEAPPSFFP